MVDFIMGVIGFIGAIYVFYIIYGGDGPNINGDDLDRVSKGGPGH
jgi:hypothetical protein